MSDWKDALDAPEARKWEYEEGDTFSGEVLDVGSYTGEYGTSPTVTIMPDSDTTEGGVPVSTDEPLIFFASPKLANDEVERLDPKVGDLFAIKYKGDKPTKDGKSTYKVFRAAIKRGTAATALAAEEKKADW